MGRGNESLFAASRSHAMHIYGKIPSKLFILGSSRPISTQKIQMYVALGIRPITVCSNDEPGLTFTYFSARSSFIA